MTDFLKKLNTHFIKKINNPQKTLEGYYKLDGNSFILLNIFSQKIIFKNFLLSNFEQFCFEE